MLFIEHNGFSSLGMILHVPISYILCTIWKKKLAFQNELNINLRLNKSFTN